MEIKFRLFRSVPREPVSRIFTRAFISNSANERLTLLTRETVQARASRSFVSPNPLFCSSESNESVKKKEKENRSRRNKNARISFLSRLRRPSNKFVQLFLD